MGIDDTGPDKVTIPSLMVFSGNANLKLASNVAKELGVPLGRAIVGRFSDGEVMVEIMENIRTRDVFVIQPTCAPTADNFIELLVMVMLGGQGTVLGPILGALAYQGMRGFLVTSDFFKDIQLAVSGVLLLLIVLFIPAGAIGWLRQRIPLLRRVLA